MTIKSTKNNSAYELLRQFIWEQGFALGSIQSNAIVNDFISQMDKRNHEHSSLAMLPSFLHMPITLDTEKSFIAIDAGGSNLRCALIKFSIIDKQYQYTITKESLHAMPGTQKKLSALEFFEALYLCIAPLLDFSDTIGFCFSYPCEISNALDGKLLRWTKEINAPEVENLWIAQALNKLFDKKGKPQKKIIVLNDTVSTLLSSKLTSEQSSNRTTNNTKNYAHIGLILGTGTNCAFTDMSIETNSGRTHEIINIESGAYNGIKNTPSDEQLDAQSLNPKEYAFEKKIAGRYLGNLCLILLNIAASQALLSINCCESIQTFSRANKNNLATEQLNELLSQNAKPNIFTNNENDKNTIRFLINAVIERAALLSALQLFAISKKIYLDLNQSKVQAASRAPMLHIDISIEGSTYYQLSGYQEKITNTLHSLMQQQGISYQLLQTKHASLLGAAIAAASVTS